MKKLPVGVDNFKKVIDNNYYYVDKTNLIKDIVKSTTEVTLFTRPRRFGKTLNMSMLKNFFEIGADSSLFDGLAISEEKELCEKHLGKHPVIFISLKGVEGNSYEEACKALAMLIVEEALRFQFLLDSSQLTENDKNIYSNLLSIETIEPYLTASLKLLTTLLEKHYGRKVIVLIDEYDVPLDKANQYGYYDKMISTMRMLLGNVLKTNISLEFAILTGCMRISKESIFTGLNNFETRSISDAEYDEYFGLTNSEVLELLHYYGLDHFYEEAKNWYDGYLFGNTHVYCPWSIIRYVKDKQKDNRMEPIDYWANSSGNAIIEEFLSKYSDSVSSEFERLLTGESLKKEIFETLTYEDVMTSPENIWSLLYMSGYLTKDNTPRNIPTNRKNFFVKIPNMEVRDIFENSAKRWMTNSITSDERTQFFTALWNNDPASLTTIISDLLFNTISYHDYAESFYHAFLAGLMSKDRYKIESNYENGLGRSDIVIKDSKRRKAAVLEIKQTRNREDIEALCDEALKQIKRERYSDKIKNDGYREVIEYGITFYKKDCLVKSNPS